MTSASSLTLWHVCLSSRQLRCSPARQGRDAKSCILRPEQFLFHFGTALYLMLRAFPPSRPLSYNYIKVTTSEKPTSLFNCLGIPHSRTCLGWFQHSLYPDTISMIFSRHDHVTVPWVAYRIESIHHFAIMNPTLP